VGIHLFIALTNLSSEQMNGKYLFAACAHLQDGHGFWQSFANETVCSTMSHAMSELPKFVVGAVPNNSWSPDRMKSKKKKASANAKC